MRTIFALATARGKSGVAVIRVSGPEALAVGRALAGSVPAPGRAALRKVRDAGGALLDEALVLSFAAPRSFTGEDVVELQCHGSMAVVAAVERAILATGKAVPAEAGEFTRRALMNDRLDLAQVEGLGELIDAETEAQRRQAVALLDGRLRAVADGWRADLLRAAALLEATIDFVDEEVPVDVAPEVRALMAGVARSLDAEIAGAVMAERVREGFVVAIIGPPNAGKSTLFNRIVRREMALISDIPGTTRDVLEARIDLGGLAVTLLDTAGLRDAADPVERMGVARARARAEAADLRVFLDLDGAAPELGVAARDGDLRYRAKADDGDGISGVTGAGVADMLAEVQRRLQVRADAVGTATNARHRSALARAVAALEAAGQVLDAQGDMPELAAEHLREAVRALDLLIGRVDVEAILGEIFSRFCIGK